jgi:hypothetical protein
VGSAYDWAAAGDLVVYSRGGLIGADGGNSPGDIWVMPMSGELTPRAVLTKPVLEQDGTLSPDGRWLAYQEGGTRPEVFVQPFPPTGRKFQISPQGGSKPLWSRDGRELFYLSSDRQLMTVAVKTADGFEPGAPQALFPVAVPVTAGRQFAVTRDGQRFLVNALHQDQRNASIVVYLNWSATVRR